MNLNELAEAYLRHFEGHRLADRWAAEQVDLLVRSDPEGAWELTRVLVDSARSDEALAYIAAGPLENLLKKHGPVVIDRFEEECRHNDRLRLALSGVWIDPTDPIFKRWYALMWNYGFAEGKRKAL